MNFTREIDLSHLLPPVSRDSLDIQELMKIQNVEARLLWETMVQIFLDEFILTAGEYGCNEWERILDIVPTSSEIEDRRFEIIQRLQGTRPYTYKKLEEMLATICGEGNYKIALDVEAYHIRVYLSLNTKHNKEATTQMLHEILPLNLGIEVLLLFNKHQDLKVYTHGIMKKWEHRALKEEVLDA